jgi:hypothetical protein|tara:strand:+ start:496 stop:801 length:306 start_codon:yes stop_codon:yes gene_type:complete
MTEPHGIDFPYQLEKPEKPEEEKMDVTALYIVADKVVARITTSEDFATKFCIAGTDETADYIVVSRDDEILWVVDGMTPGWYIPENTKAVLDRYPELKGKF